MITPTERLKGSTVLAAFVEALRRGTRSSDRKNHRQDDGAFPKQGRANPVQDDTGKAPAPEPAAESRKNSGNLLNTYA